MSATSPPIPHLKSPAHARGRSPHADYGQGRGYGYGHESDERDPALARKPTSPTFRAGRVSAAARSASANAKPGVSPERGRVLTVSGHAVVQT